MTSVECTGCGRPIDAVLRPSGYCLECRFYNMVETEAALLLQPRPPIEGLGREGVRDPEYPCSAFVPGRPGRGDCESDGHYFCASCHNKKPEASND